MKSSVVEIIHAVNLPFFFKRFCTVFVILLSSPVHVLPCPSIILVSIPPAHKAVENPTVCNLSEPCPEMPQLVSSVEPSSPRLSGSLDLSNLPMSSRPPCTVRYNSVWLSNPLNWIRWLVLTSTWTMRTFGWWPRNLAENLEGPVGYAIRSPTQMTLKLDPALQFKVPGGCTCVWMLH